MSIRKRITNFFRRGARVLSPSQADVRAIFPEEDVKPPSGTVVAAPHKEPHGAHHPASDAKERER